MVGKGGVAAGFQPFGWFRKVLFFRLISQNARCAGRPVLDAFSYSRVKRQRSPTGCDGAKILRAHVRTEARQILHCQ
jgi:hypothetical protein